NAARWSRRGPSRDAAPALPRLQTGAGRPAFREPGTWAGGCAFPLGPPGGRASRSQEGLRDATIATRAGVEPGGGRAAPGRPPRWPRRRAARRREAAEASRPRDAVSGQQMRWSWAAPDREKEVRAGHPRTPGGGTKKSRTCLTGAAWEGEMAEV